EQDSDWTASLDLTTDIGNAPIAVNLPLAHFTPGKMFEVQKLRAHYRDASLFADGVVGLSDHPSRLRFGANLPDLAAMLKAFDQKEIPGRIELAGSVRGAIDKPALDARLKYSNGPQFAGKASEANLHAQVDLDHATAKLELKADAGHAHAQAKLDSKWRRGQPLAAAVKVADNTLDLEFGGVSLATLLQPPDPDMRSQFDGQLNGKLSVRGNQNKLKVETQIRATRLRAVADPASLDMIVNGKYERGSLQFEMKAGDKRGQLASLVFNDDVHVERLIQQPGDPMAIVTGTHWKAALDFAPRQVRELPIVSGLGVSWEYAPLTVSTSAHIEHQPHAEPVGQVKTTLRWEPLPDAAESGTCSDTTHGALTLMGELHDGELGVTIEGGTQSEKAIELETGMHAKFEELLAGVHKDIGPLKFKAHIRDLDLATVPMVCTRGKGVISAEVDATDLFYELANIKLSASGRRVQWDDSPPVELSANAHAEDNHLRVDAKIGSGAGALQLDGRLP
ncbi:MAG TPA: hypothetical protein VHZ95_04930, partial [Polyangiales bacterium]|nr:hypothetical protein [Polyangiales bacterium]